MYLWQGFSRGLENISFIDPAEDNCLVNEGIINEGEISLKMGLSGNPYISESTMVFRDLSIAEYVSGRIHIPHVSTEKSVNLIKTFLNKGVNVTSEVTPHHLCLTDSLIKNYDNNAKVAPPIRSEYDRKALINGVKSGIINCIATDHAPHAIEDKEKKIKCIGLVGNSKFFSPGADINELKKLNQKEAKKIKLFDSIKKIEKIKKPLISFIE